MEINTELIKGAANLGKASLRKVKDLLPGVPKELLPLLGVSVGSIALLCIFIGKNTNHQNQATIERQTLAITTTIIAQNEILEQRLAGRINTLVLSTKESMLARLERIRVELAARIELEAANTIRTTLEVEANSRELQINTLTEMETRYQAQMAIAVRTLEDTSFTREMVRVLYMIYKDQQYTGPVSEEVYAAMVQCRAAEEIVTPVLLGPGINIPIPVFSPFTQALVDRCSVSTTGQVAEVARAQNEIIVANVARRNAAFAGALERDCEAATEGYHRFQEEIQSRHLEEDQLQEQSFTVRMTGDRPLDEFVQAGFAPWSTRARLQRRLKRLTISGYTARMLCITERINAPHLGEVEANIQTNVWGVFATDSELLPRPVLLLRKDGNNRFHGLVVQPTTLFAVEIMGQMGQHA